MLPACCGVQQFRIQNPKILYPLRFLFVRLRLTVALGDYSHLYLVLCCHFPPNPIRKAVLVTAVFLESSKNVYRLADIPHFLVALTAADKAIDED